MPETDPLLDYTVYYFILTYAIYYDLKFDGSIFRLYIQSIISYYVMYE
jgi:hypothetical protein